MIKFLKRINRTLRKIVGLRRALPTYLHWKRELASDPLFQLSNVDRALEPQATSRTRSDAERTESARRIIAAYRKASRDQQGQREVYKVSYMWIPIFREPLMPLIEMLETGNAEGLRDLLDNFFRSSISQGLCGLATDMNGAFFKKRASRFARTQMLIDALYRFRFLQKLIPGLKPADLHVENFGNPYGMFVGNEFVRTGTDYQYYYAHRVTGMLPVDQGRSTVVELGGGIGGFGYFVNRLGPKSLTYVNLDLPEILCISSYQMLNLFPEKKILLYGEVDRIDSATLASYDIAMMPSFVVESMDTDSVDVCFNSYSLAEMGAETIANYAHHLGRISKRAIMHVNHVAEAAMSADQFAFDTQKFTLESRTRALWNLGRDLKCDEYEFVLTRRPA